MKFLVETTGIVNHQYLIEAEDTESAVEKFNQSDNLIPEDTLYLGELISDVIGMCEEHYQEYLEAKNEGEEDIKQEEKAIHRSMN